MLRLFSEVDCINKPTFIKHYKLSDQGATNICFGLFKRLILQRNAIYLQPLEKLGSVNQL